jgi:hypothetical protein
VANIMGFRPRTPPRDRTAPRSGRHQRPPPHPVPGRRHPARPGRWRGRRRPRSGAAPPSTPAPEAGPSSSLPRLGSAGSPRRPYRC